MHTNTKTAPRAREHSRFVAGCRHRVGLAAALAIAGHGASAAGTLCAGNEEVVFNCASTTRTVSVCAAHDAKGALEYVQYRFGKHSPELSIPALSPFQREKVHGFASTGNHGGAEGIEFENAEYSYIVESSWDMRSGEQDGQWVAIRRNNSPQNFDDVRQISGANARTEGKEVLS